MLIFIQAWLNEKFAPELLGYKTDIVECILEIIREMVSLKGGCGGIQYRLWYTEVYCNVLGYTVIYRVQWCGQE